MSEEEKAPEVRRGSQEYHEGRNAFMDGNKTNPYPVGIPRMDWYVGWYDARTVDKYGPEFDWSKPENIPLESDSSNERLIA